MAAPPRDIATPRDSPLPKITARTRPQPVHVRSGATLLRGRALAEREWYGVRQILISVQGRLTWISSGHVSAAPDRPEQFTQ